MCCSHTKYILLHPPGAADWQEEAAAKCISCSTPAAAIISVRIITLSVIASVLRFPGPVDPLCVFSLSVFLPRGFTLTCRPVLASWSASEQPTASAMCSCLVLLFCESILRARYQLSGKPTIVCPRFIFCTLTRKLFLNLQLVSVVEFLLGV